MVDKYNDTALHFDRWQLPELLKRFLQPGPISLADVGCGDGPWFNILGREGYISPERPVYAVDLEPVRLARVKQRFPWISVVVSPADEIPQIPKESLDWVISTMVIEHVPDEAKYLEEICRLLKPPGKAYISTVFKRTWAWYFRKRDGKSVLDTSHLREYTNIDSFRNLIAEQKGLRIQALELIPMRFPVLDPLLFKAGKQFRISDRVLKLLRSLRVPIPGYSELHVILEKNN